MQQRPVIGISCSTLAAQEVGDHRRFALPDYYVECVLTAGGLPLVLPSIGPEHAAAYLTRLDGLVLSGGGDVDPHTFGEEPHPELGLVDRRRDDFEIELCRGVREQRMPLLAICRGVQVLNIAYGGAVIQHIPAEVESPIRHTQQAVRRSALSHSIDVVEGSHLHGMVGGTQTTVNSFHHQAAGRVGEGLEVTATAPDGVIEALEDPAHPFCVGVQWHPERRLDDPLTQALFRGVVEAARSVAHAGA